MAIVEGNGETDLSQLWSLIAELSEQLNRNRSMSVSLYGLTGNIKHEALNSATGFVLRRFNMDKTDEEYETQLDTMNAAVTLDNQALQYDNKQLNALIKEYEQTLENLMSAFRNRAKDVQEGELSLIREYEAKLLLREEELAAKDLLQTSSISHSLVHLSHLLRQILRSVSGEEISESPAGDDDDEDIEMFKTSATAIAASEHALQRDVELTRLEKENEELRRLAGLLPPEQHHRRDSSVDFQPIFAPPHSNRFSSIFGDD